MKKILIAAIALLALAGCKKSEQAAEPFSVTVGEFSVEDFVYERSTPSIGEPSSYVNVIPRLEITAAGEGTYTVGWTVEPAGGGVITPSNSRVDDMDCAVLPGDYIPAVGDKITATINDGTKDIVRSHTIAETEVERDYHNLSFGMSMEQVRYREARRLDREPKFFSNGGGPDRKIFSTSSVFPEDEYSFKHTLYVFEDDELVQIGDFVYAESEVPQKLKDYCYSLGLTETVEEDEDHYLKKPYYWRNGKMEFLLKEEYFLLDYPDTGRQTFSGVCYRLNQRFE